MSDNKYVQIPPVDIELAQQFSDRFSTNCASDTYDIDIVSLQLLQAGLNAKAHAFGVVSCVVALNNVRTRCASETGCILNEDINTAR